MSEAQKKDLKIGWSWTTPDGWALHRETKDNLWKMLNTDNISAVDIIKGIIALSKINEKWIEVDTRYKIPINYKLLHFIGKQYLSQYRTLKPSILYRLGIKKIVILFLVLFKEDSAYCERFGGICQYIIDHPEDWPKDDKEARLLAMRDIKEWWYDEDWRARGKDKLAKIFDMAIEYYEKDEFVRRSIDFWIDSLLLNGPKWNRGVNKKTGRSYFEPKSWYPRGKGQANYLVHGRRS